MIRLISIEMPTSDNKIAAAFKRLGFCIALGVLFLSLATPGFSLEAKSYFADYDIIGSKVLVTLTVELKEESQGFAWRLPRDAEQLESNASLVMKRKGDYNEVSTNETVSIVHFSYATELLLEESKDNYFILDFSHINYDKLSIIVRLPEGAKLRHSLESGKASVIPSTSSILTDGRRIIIRWTESDFRTSKALLVIYETPKNYSWLFALLAGLAFGALAFIVSAKYFSLRKIKIEKNFQDKLVLSSGDDGLGLTRNLLEDEKLIVEVLLKEKSRELWQRTLQLRTGLSKVRLSRKLRSLEAKGLVDKISYGNAKKIRLKA
jgi:uncharacterized membrane protein